MVGRSEIRKNGACTNPAGCIYACMARSVRSYVASVELKLLQALPELHQRALENSSLQTLSQDKAGISNHA